MPHGIYRALAGAGALCLLLMAIGSTGRPDIPGLHPMHVHVQAALFVAGVALIAYGLGGVPGRHGRATPDAIPLALITLLAFGLRLWALETRVHFMVDEAHFIEGALNLADRPTTSLLSPMGLIPSFTWLYAYAQSWSIDAFGTNLLAIRCVSVVFGTLTVPAVYGLARTLRLGRSGAVLAALLLATFPPHIHFSRIGLNNIADPLFGVLAFAMVARGLRTGRARDFAWAGVLLGLAQVFYEGGRIVYPITVGLWLLGAWWARRGSRIDRAALLRGVRRLLVGFGLVALPLLITLLARGDRYLPRLTFMQLPDDYWADLLLGGDAELSLFVDEQIAPAFLHYVTEPDGSQFYYGGDIGLVPPLLLIPFVIGLAWLLWRRDGGGRAILLVLLLAALGNMLLTFPGWTARYSVTLPFLPVITAAGFVAAWRGATRVIESPSPLSRAMRRDGVGFSVRAFTHRLALIAWAGAALLALIPVGVYFGPHLDTYNDQIRPDLDHQDVAWRVKDLPPGTRAFVITDEPVFIPHVDILARYWGVPLDITWVTPLTFATRGGVARLPREGPLALFVEPSERETLNALAQVFDLSEARWSPHDVPRDRQYVLFVVGDS